MTVRPRGWSGKGVLQDANGLPIGRFDCDLLIRTGSAAYARTDAWATLKGNTFAALAGTSAPYELLLEGTLAGLGAQALLGKPPDLDDCANLDAITFPLENGPELLARPTVEEKFSG